MVAVLIFEREQPLIPFSVAPEGLYSDRFLKNMNQIVRILLIWRLDEEIGMMIVPLRFYDREGLKSWENGMS